MLVLLLLLPLVHCWEPCGVPDGCLCSAPILHEIVCSNITDFPLLPEEVKPGVGTIKFYRTELRHLPPFPKEDWLQLQRFTFRDNPLLGCETIEELKLQGFTVHSDCSLPLPPDCVIAQPTPPPPLFPILGCVSFILSTGTIVCAFLTTGRVRRGRAAEQARPMTLV